MQIRQLHPLVFSFFLLATSISSQGQSALLDKADRHFSKKDYTNALAYYQQGINGSVEDARLLFRAGFAALQEMQYDFAVDCLSRAFALDPNADPYLEYHLGMACSQIHDYTRAITHLRSHRGKSKSLAHLVDSKIRECIFADSLLRLPPRTTVTPLTEFNTESDEIAPLITGDQHTLLFTSNRTEDGSRNRSNMEDVYVATRRGAVWTEPEKISEVINVKPLEAAVWLSPDGTTVLLYYEDGQGDIYQSDFVEGEWTTPQPLNSFINKPNSRESGACISPDGQRLYFASNRPGGKGGFDLYVSQRTPDGDWGRPSNLGSPVNSRGNEEYPFVHTDGTLFFSSDGHVTLGGTDIFRARQENGRWASPENLGYPINSAGFDGYFVLSADGQTGYFASRRNGAHIDLYQTEQLFTPMAYTPHGTASTPDHPRTLPKDATARLHGTVTDSRSQEPVVATITIVNHDNDSTFTAQSDASGSFSIILPAGDYGLTVISNQYLPSSTRLVVPSSAKPAEIAHNVLMEKAGVGSTVVLRNVFFDTNEYALKPESRAELRKLHDLLANNAGWKIQINGHTDNVGDRNLNINLSLKRAQSVVDYLVELGIQRERLSARGFGPDRPLVSNDDEEEGREINRRTEIEIVALK